MTMRSFDLTACLFSLIRYRPLPKLFTVCYSPLAIPISPIPVENKVGDSMMLISIKKFLAIIDDKIRGQRSRTYVVTDFVAMDIRSEIHCVCEDLYNKSGNSTASSKQRNDRSPQIQPTPLLQDVFRRSTASIDGIRTITCPLDELFIGLPHNAKCIRHNHELHHGGSN